MCDWIEEIVELLMPLYLALKRESLALPYIEADAYAGYNEVFVPEGCLRLAWLAHIRRKFIEVQASAGSECTRILKLISEVYRSEASTKTPDARFAVRQARTRPLLVTCQLNKVNPWEWLSDVLVRVNVPSDDTAVSLLPMN